MEAPPTPKPEFLTPSPDLSPPTAIQYAGIAYITFAGLVDTMVPSTRPWALCLFYGGLFHPPNRASWQPSQRNPHWDVYPDSLVKIAIGFYFLAW
ncbi:hypothetical protein DSO57_1003966 [Entomophthora muscae]|uniref:Uncharacterized protein n=1 Tax=Entomophthora muscae TaxID=34485 RepID=A0ACC2TVZ4_9FUNG|nr:hypothetical protein DSO57_1003966 [Entomophthora muscae]